MLPCVRALKLVHLSILGNENMSLENPSTSHASQFDLEQRRAKSVESIQILVLQPTGFCNINCSYCYLPERDAKTRMSFNVVQRVADQILASDYVNKDTLVLWHAGEPCAVPISWYSKVYAILQASAKHKLRYQFQSNGTLITDEWVKFLRETGSTITLSIDGPAMLHDAHRLDRKGKGTFERVLDGAKRLKAGGVKFSCIAVVTQASLSHAEEIFNFFHELDPISVGFSTEEAEGANATSSVYQVEALAGIRRFFDKLTELNLASSSPLRIRELEQVLLPLTNDPRVIVQNQECALAAMVTIAADGTIAFFSPEHLTTIREDGSRLVSGNLLTSSFSEIVNASATVTMETEISKGVENCRRDCSYFRFCGGGAPSNKYWEHGRFDGTETWHCRVTKQAVTDGILSAISKVGGGRAPT